MRPPYVQRAQRRAQHAQRAPQVRYAHALYAHAPRDPYVPCACVPHALNPQEGPGSHGSRGLTSLC